ncbi:MAG: hypothetical protein ACO1QR_05180 [Chthoniobacteraceae bacterium]
MPDYAALLRVIEGETVFGLESDSRIRQAANQMSALALLSLFKTFETAESEWSSRLAEMLSEVPTTDPTYLIGFDIGQWEGLGAEEPEEPSEYPDDPSVHYLKLRFRNEDAAYYQFHLFPVLDEPYVMGAARKREGACQHLRIDLARPELLQAFIENLRRNPHLLAVEESSEEEFLRAPSNAV